MFLFFDDCQELIVKRRCRALAVSAALLLGTLELAPVWAQPTRTQEVNLRDHIYRGNSLLQRRDYEGAIAEYEQALEIDPMSSTAKENIVLSHNNWGIDLFRQKKYDEAKEQWSTALKLNPYDRNACNNLNVLKTTLAKLGTAAASSPALPGESDKGGKAPADGDTKSGPSVVLPKGSQTAKEDVMPNAVILGRPTSPGAGGDSTAGGSGTASGASLVGGSGAAVIFNSSSHPSTMGGAAVSVAAPTPPAAAVPAPATSTPPPQRNNPYGTSTLGFPAPKSNPYADTPPPPPPKPVDSAPAASSTSSALSGANIDDKLTALETKVYGHASKETPLLQRLERLERDTSSRPSVGNINDRVQTLLKTYGL
jgi:hypothetical protein